MTGHDRPLTGGSGPVTEAARLVEWAFGLTLDAVPAPAVRAAVRHLTDGFGCAVAAPPHGAAAVEVALGLGGPPQATVIGTGRRDRKSVV